MPPLDSQRDTRRVLLDRARELLLDEGLPGFSMRKVATACDLSAAAIYRHFESKDELVSRVIEDGARRFTSYLLEALRESTPRARLRRLGEKYFDFALEHPREYELLFVQDCHRLGFPLVDRAAQDESKSSFRLLVDRVRECQIDGSVAPGSPEAIAVFIWSSVHGIASLHLSGHLGVGDADLRALLSAQLDHVLRAVDPRH